MTRITYAILLLLTITVLPLMAFAQTAGSGGTNTQFVPAEEFNPILTPIDPTPLNSNSTFFDDWCEINETGNNVDAGTWICWFDIEQMYDDIIILWNDEATVLQVELDELFVEVDSLNSTVTAFQTEIDELEIDHAEDMDILRTYWASEFQAMNNTIMEMGTPRNYINMTSPEVVTDGDTITIEGSFYPRSTATTVHVIIRSDDVGGLINEYFWMDKYNNYEWSYVVDTSGNANRDTEYKISMNYGGWGKTTLWESFKYCNSMHSCKYIP